MRQCVETFASRIVGRSTGVSMGQRALCLASVVCFTSAGCSLDLDPPPLLIQARFDPAARVLPMPNDMVRDFQANVLALPIPDDLSPAEKELRGWLNQQDGFPSTFTSTMSFSAPVDDQTIDKQTLQVWRWGDTPVELEVTHELDKDGMQLSILPPELGWDRGRTYMVVVRGGKDGVHGEHREEVVADAAFWFLRSKQKLDDPKHQRAFPGATRDERIAKAAELEEHRVRLQPQFDFLAQRGIPREEIAALWTFTATTRNEVAMDAASQRMPVPFDLLIDRKSGRIDLPARATDGKVESEGKKRLADYDGWGLSAGLMFEATAPIAATLDPDAVALWEIAQPPRRVPAKLKVYSDRRHVELTPDELPLKEHAAYAVVVRDSFLGEDKRPVAPMTIGHFMRAKAPLEVNGKSEIGSVADEDAQRLEWTRKRVAPLLDQIGRDHVVTAWPVTTQTVVPLIKSAIGKALQVAPIAKPENLKKLTPLQALGDFALGISSLLYVKDVYYGTLKLPTFLDERTRGWRADNEHTMRDVAFTLITPKNVAGQVPVVIFGHAIATERRFVLAIGDALARKGFAAISIDFPYHGLDTRCVEGALIAVPDPQTGELLHLPPCESGSTCNEFGRCVDASGQGNHVAQWPILSFPVASGAAFIEIEHIANTRDHFLQAVLDLNGLHRSLKEADWQGAGITFNPKRVQYAGQSLGGIIGGTFVSLDTELERSVLNVPGSDLVDMFRDSTYFASHVNAFFTREKIDPQSWEAARFLNLARVFVDGVDPQSVAHEMKGRNVLLQKATLDFIIPNAYTDILGKLSGAPIRDYIAEHAFIVIPVEPAFARGQSDLADFLAGTLKP
jgi:hypothetical protein